MKFILVISLITAFGNGDFNIVTNRSYDTIQECTEHEFFIDTPQFNFSVMCIDEWELDSFIDEAPAVINIRPL